MSTPSPSTESLNSVIDRFNSGDPDETTDKTIAEIGLPEPWATQLRPAIRQWVLMRFRAGRSSIEQRVVRGTHHPHITVPRFRFRGRGNILSERDEFFASRFPIGGGRWVSWDEATQADHEDRIKMQSKMMGGIRRDIDIHKKGIALLDKYAVTRGSDLTEEQKDELVAVRKDLS